MEDPKSKKGAGETQGAGGPQGVSVPAKGDSSGSIPPLDHPEGATLSDVPPTPAGSPPPPATREIPPEVTISDSLVASIKSPERIRQIAQSYTKEAVLQPGDLIGGRYEILQLLGEGGMGAVYKALDRTVARAVALKLIRPELASNPAILARFKQELITAHQVTHRNVVRIYDLVEAEGIQFITMEFVEGSDLRHILTRDGKLPPEKAIGIIRQVCLALDAAHSVGIIHRDLKPQNIMQETKSGRVLVMDFGLARSVESEGMTQSGALLGTIEYMSPEQSMGQTLDQRSDIFAVGLIFYEMLTGKTPYKADSVMASLLRRNQERAVPVAHLDSSVPEALSDIVAKCLERDLAHRYQNVQQILADLDAYQGARPTLASVVIPSPVAAKPAGLAIPWKWAAGGLAALLLIAAGVAFRLMNSKPKAAHAPVSVLVADFTNYTGDPIFDGTLEPMFNVALEGASFLNAYNRGSARQLAQKLPHPTDKLDEQSARLVAISQGLGAVVTGSLSQRGDGYKLSVEALDARTGKSIATAEVNASTKDQLLLDVPKLAAPIRKALGDTTPESVQLTAAGGAFQAASLEAAHQYGVAMDQQFAGKMEESLASFTKVLELDPNFARAYAGMAGSAANLGRTKDAEKYLKLAMEHVDRMTERERYRIRGYYYLQTENWEKCVEEYSELVKQYPADNIGHNNLSICYKGEHNTPKAMEELRRSLEVSPNNDQRTNLALDLAYTGDFQAAEQEARKVLQANPGFETGYAALAYAQVGQGQLAEAIKTYQQLEKVSDYGQSGAAQGLADIALYEGRLTDADRFLETGAAADLKAGRLDSAAADYAMLAQAQLLRKQKAAALAASDKALANSKTVSTRFAVARIYAAAGETAKATKLAEGLATETELEAQVYAKLIEGEVALAEKDPRRAIKVLNEANKQLDTWIGRFDLGRAYLDAGMFTEADSEFDRCIKRRGETLDLFDYVPTYNYLPEAYYYQGRAREGLNSPGFRDSYQTYLSIRGKAGEDPLLPEIRRRLGQ